MISRFTIFSIFYFLISCNSFKGSNDNLHFEKLLCEYQVNPINVGTPSPRFTWLVNSKGQSKRQAAYQLFISEDKNLFDKENRFLWDSGKVISDQTMNVQSPKEILQSGTDYFWKVKVWDEHGEMIESEIQKFSTSLLSPDDWKAKWIGMNSGIEPELEKGFLMDQKEEEFLNDTVKHFGRSVLLRKEFDLRKSIKSAKLFITGLGFYEVSINGSRVGDHVLAPAKTPYHKYILFDTYDVTELLNQDKNVVGIHLGNGWYNPYKKWWKEYRMQWFGYKKALAQLKIEYDDGSSELIITDENWKAAPGPIIYNCVYDGEIYDANEEVEDWSKSNFDDSHWQSAVLMKSPQTKLLAEQMPPVKINEIKKPVHILEPEAGMKVYDLGQNFTGWVRMKLKGKKGTRITIRHSEELYDDGTLNFTCNEKARATAEYISKGGDEEYYEPRFTYFGFQYVEITSSGEMPEILDLEGCVVYSSNERIGALTTSYPLINKMHHATVWSQMSNMLSYPMDCPQRDERLGWMGDAQVTAEEAMYNFDMKLFYENWFRGIRENQDITGDIPIISPRPYIKDDGIEWSSSYITMVWNHYQYYGDHKVLIENYDSMVRYMDYLAAIADHHILPHGWIGDWGSMVEGWEEGEPVSTPTAYYFYNATIVKKIAKILNKDQDYNKFELLASDIKKAYNKEYFDSLSKNYNDGSQMANAFPLYLGLVDKQNEETVLTNLVNDIVVKNSTHLTTGVLGTKYLIDALSMKGRSDVAWDLATQTTYPSWAEMMKRFNTMCEFWTLKQSHNHVMMGSIDAWFYKVLAGIQLKEGSPAFKNFIIKPYLASDLDHVSASTNTLRGEIASEWEKSEKGFVMKVKIPFNTTADIYVPGEKEDHIIVNEKNGYTKGADFVTFRDGYHVFKVMPGAWTFSLDHK